MSLLYSLQNSSPLIEKKVNFFHDWFLFYANKVGRLYDFELDNPSSLIEKIIFQIENNFDKCIPYIDDYFKSNYFINDDFLCKFNQFNKVTSLLIQYKHQKILSKRKTGLEITPNF